jgi:2,4-didehydro-3-deoxy-L-rhamnonate hydrolase
MGPTSTSNRGQGVVALAQGSHAGGPSRPWLVHRGRAVQLMRAAAGTPLAELASVDALIRGWDQWADDLRDLTGAAGTPDTIARHGLDVHDLALDAPVTPGQVFCTIGNYCRQVVEAAVDSGDGPEGRGAPARRAEAVEATERRRRTGVPYICLTSPHRVAPPRGHLVVPPDVDTLDWEVEVAAVLAGKNVVAGYCLANDLTIRTRVQRVDVPALATDWVQSKGMSGSLPLGPWFVPEWQVPDVSALRLQLFVNDMPMQDDNAGDMVFDISQQVAYLSRHTSVRSGDVICTGSPAGFGAHHGRYLRPGDVVRAHVAELGEQRIECVAPDSRALDLEDASAIAPPNANAGAR